MARAYAKIAIALWQSRKFRALKGDDAPRLMYFYLHTCPQVNSVGCFHLPLGYAATDLGWGEADILGALGALSDERLIDWDEPEGMVRIVGFIEHDPPTNPKHGAALVGALRSVHDGRFKLAVARELQGSPHCAKNEHLQAIIDSLSIAYQDPISLSLPVPSPVPVPQPDPLATLVASATPDAPKRTRARRGLPDDFPFQADLDWAKERWLTKGRADLCEAIADEVAAFRDHHAAKDTKSADWPASWRTWVGNAMRFTHARRPASGSGLPQHKILKVVS